ncbi:LysR family transcriptional regulator [Oribacterium sp. WCC10]|uniref:LysR family transcriptional regulator n=1 Tax=Oribacterium sp. WCC10 TaxID=1855343 RepID=UPI0008E5D879|nr:LysR family transcriptional regulator [Oribacterium sp. WCC10]SFG30811.1 DNA-binding transcriptional regulator, LysR family [Oribacterium sp. WCC10]
MKISSLKYFIAIAETGSINKAAKKLFVAQPSLTKSIKLMESELGVTLFERNKSGIQLTSEGEKIYKEAQIVLDYYNGWKQLSKENDPMTIYAYTHISLVGFLIPKLHIPFQRNHTNVLLKYQGDAAPEKMVSLKNTNPALAICLNRIGDHEDSFNTNGIKRVTLMEGYYGCLVSTDSPLSRFKTVHFSDLKGYCLAFPSHSSTLDENVSEVRAYSMLSGFVPDLVKEITIGNVITVDSVQTVIKMASEQPEVFAVSFFPANTRYADYQNGHMVCIPFYEKETKGEISLVYSDKHYKSISAYRDLVELIKSEAESFIKKSIEA